MTKPTAATTPPTDNTRPPLEWVATTAAQLWQGVTPPDGISWNDPEWDREGHAVEIAWRIWQRAAVKVTGALAEGVDWWALAFEPGTGFEEAAQALKIHPASIPAGSAGFEWKPVAEVAARLYPGVSRARAMESLLALSRCMKWAGHYRGPEHALEFSPWQARELWKARQLEIRDARTEAGRTRAAMATPAAEKAAGKRKTPAKRNRWQYNRKTAADSDRRTCTATGRQQAKNSEGHWVDRRKAN
jgi:hypothetical protein